MAANSLFKVNMSLLKNTDTIIELGSSYSPTIINLPLEKARRLETNAHICASSVSRCLVHLIFAVVPPSFRKLGVA